MYERAAAVAVFNNDIPTAINILSEGANARVNSNSEKGKHYTFAKLFECMCLISLLAQKLCFIFSAPLDPFLGMVAMALSGYTEEKTSLWRDHCLQLCKQVW